MNKLVVLRAKKGLTLKQLSKESGVAAATISRIETGKQLAFPSTLGKLAAALKVEVEELAEFAIQSNTSADEGVYQPDTEELVELMERIEQAEKVASIPHDQVKLELTRLKAARRNRKAS